MVNLAIFCIRPKSVIRNLQHLTIYLHLHFAPKAATVFLVWVFWGFIFRLLWFDNSCENNVALLVLMLLLLFFPHLNTTNHLSVSEPLCSNTSFVSQCSYSFQWSGNVKSAGEGALVTSKLQLLLCFGFVLSHSQTLKKAPQCQWMGSEDRG